MPSKDREGDSVDTLSTLACAVTSSDEGESGAVGGEARSSGESRGWKRCRRGPCEVAGLGTQLTASNAKSVAGSVARWSLLPTAHRWKWGLKPASKLPSNTGGSPSPHHVRMGDGTGHRYSHELGLVGAGW